VSNAALSLNNQYIVADSSIRYVIGRNIHANTVEQLFDGTNAVFLALLTGNSDPSTPPEIGVSIHVDDVAELHVLALDQSKVKKAGAVENFLISRGKQYAIATSTGNPLTETDITWDDVTKIATQKFPEAVASGQVPATGTKKSKPGISDASKAEKVLGRELKSLEDMVTDVTSQYLEVLSKA
jgi:nucleoside-diphosphate-sugar epimerase